MPGAAWAENGLGDVLICDDGLQHYRLPRDIELAVFDARQGIGNGAIIPVGPLREPVERLGSVDFVILNGAGFPESGETLDSFAGVDHPDIHAMELVPSALVNLNSGETVPPEKLKGKPVRAVAGIGNPGRFFDTLRGWVPLNEVPFLTMGSDRKTWPPVPLSGWDGRQGCGEMPWLCARQRLGVDGRGGYRNLLNNVLSSSSGGVPGS